ncbi:RNA cap guanine-N2 methyltransferase [Tanacetum coccineum]
MMPVSKWTKRVGFRQPLSALQSNHASRCGKGVVVDCFTGVGGNAISTHVIAIDIDPKKIEYAKQNAAVYEVEDNIDFITGDSFVLAKNLKILNVLFDVAKQIAPRVVMFLPRNVNLGQLADLALSTTPPWTLEVEKNFINGNLKAITDPSLVDSYHPAAREDTIGNFRVCLELQEMTLEKNTREGYFTLLNFGEKATEEIHKVQLGINSVEVTHCGRLLGVIYTVLQVLLK